jgi:group I intron endonuclease
MHASFAAIPVEVCPTPSVVGSSGQTGDGGDSICTALAIRHPGIIYRLTSPSGKSYVGQTRMGLATRLREHQRKDSYCRAICAAILKYGINNFRCETLLAGVMISNLNALEAFALGLSVSKSPFGYNLGPGGNALMTVSPETRARLSLAGKQRAPEVIARIAANHRGAKLSKETKAKIAARHVGRKCSPEQCERIAQAQRGKSLSEAHKRSISRSLKGHLVEATVRAKIGAGNRGLPRSPELRARIAATKTGSKASEETRARMSAVHLARHAELRKLKGKKG